MNAKKTQAMTTKGCVETIQMTGVGLTYRQHKAQRVNCPVCDKVVQQCFLKNHISFKHHDEYVDTFQDQLEPTAQEEPSDEGIFLCNMPTGSKASADCPLCGVNIT